MANPKELLKEYLLKDADKYLEQKDSVQKEIAQRKAKKKLEEIEAQTKLKTAMAQKLQYEQQFSNAAEELSMRMVDQWNAENAARKQIKDDSEKLQSALADAENQFLENQQALFNKLDNAIDGYITCCRTINKDKAPSYSNVICFIRTNAEVQFTDLKKRAQAVTDKMAKAKIKLSVASNLNLDLAFNTEHISQKIAEIPLKIEDQIQDIKDKLDMLLGKFLVSMMDPDKPDFDIDALIGKLEGIISPVMSCISPLEAVGGKVPVIGDLIAMLSMISSSASNKSISAEDLKKLVPSFPELPPNLMDKAKGVMDDVMAVAMQLPMLLINVILQMVNVIYSKLQIITSIIPLGSFFPLDLINSAISAVPKMIPFIWQAPALMYTVVKGIIKQKLAEAMALSIPSPHIDLGALASQLVEIDDSEAEKPSTKFKPDAKKIDYADVNAEKYKQISAYGYDSVDLARILKNYKEIYDGSNGMLNRYVASGNTLFIENGAIVRHKPSPEDYRDTCPAGGLLSVGILYEELNKVPSIVGGQYWLYEDYIKQKLPADKIVTVEMLKP